jgi:hypothetical protein
MNKLLLNNIFIMKPCQNKANIINKNIINKNIINKNIINKVNIINKNIINKNIINKNIINKNIINKNLINIKQLTINQMKIHIFILCYNEELLLSHTINHYRKYIPDCKITIYDNQSNDNSVNIAKELGCEIKIFNTNNKNDPLKKRDIFNTCWKNSDAHWIIVADMDEWLCITKEELFNEYKKNVTILKIVGYDMIGESKEIDLTDIDLHNINKSVPNKFENKNICFYKPSIQNMNYTPGHHLCNPNGKIKYSNKTYILKHLNFLGLEYLINKITQRYKRSIDTQKSGMSTHYTNDINKIKNNYNNKLKNALNINI